MQLSITVKSERGTKAVRVRMREGRAMEAEIMKMKVVERKKRKIRGVKKHY